jgi:pyruvate/2-oxoglutarate dehydrogenase complex dihydrolipoamide acyltransferase (E2) component
MPQLGETVTEGTLTRWLTEVGAPVSEGDPLFEVATDKVDTEVPAPVSGTLSEILVEVDQTVPVGTRLAVISDGVKKNRHRATPLVRRILSENGIDVETLSGTGADGRVTRTDAEAAIAALTKPVPVTPAIPEPAAVPAPTAPVAGPVVVPFSTVRRRTAEHMVRSKAVSPHTFMAIEVDFAAVDVARKHGTKLTYLPFIARAVVDAIAEYPHLNASVGDNELLVHPAVHLGIAVDLDADGLVVPVVRDVADKRLPAIAREISTLAARARARELGADAYAGGTFTISNPGPYGTLMTVAIINQPQVAILATDAVRPRPVAVPYPDGTYGVTVHPVGNLGLSFDHRAIDGGYAARFLAKTKQILEQRAWLAEL